jgi:tRNA dimethylallyltransferase
MNAEGIKLIIITGPTASGKSSLAVEMAMRFGGEIINSDSMQVYSGMDIGTAKLPVNERKGIAHHMIDVVNPDEKFNAAIYRKLAEPIIKDISGRQKACFVVGGTGLYIKALLGGLIKLPEINAELRKDLNRECKEHGSGYLHERLVKLDPKSARNIHPNDRIRIIRALEIINMTGRPFSSLISQHGFSDRGYKALKICLKTDRKLLYNRINERSAYMFKSGLIEEAENLLAIGYTEELQPMKSLGYRHAIEYLNNVRNLENTVLQLQKDTRRYAKRQLTWFRPDPEMVWVDPEDRDFIVQRIREFI